MIWTLKIKLLSGRWVEKDWEATVALDASSTLADLHHIIRQAVGFDNDHLYGFYVARTPWSRERVRYDGSEQCGWYGEDDDGGDCEDEEEDCAEEEMPRPLRPWKGCFHYRRIAGCSTCSITGTTGSSRSAGLGISRSRRNQAANGPACGERGEKPPQYPEPDFTIQSP